MTGQKATSKLIDQDKKIHEGGRNIELTRRARSYFREGLDEETVRKRLLRENQLHCHPPLGLKEVESIVRSIGLRWRVGNYLLEKWNRKCAYCGKTDTLLEIEHIIPRSRGGSDEISNLTVACKECNLRKKTKTAEEFGYPMMQDKAKEFL